MCRTFILHICELFDVTTCDPKFLSLLCLNRLYIWLLGALAGMSIRGHLPFPENANNKTWTISRPTAMLFFVRVCCHPVTFHFRKTHSLTLSVTIIVWKGKVENYLTKMSLWTVTSSPRKCYAGAVAGAHFSHLSPNHLWLKQTKCFTISITQVTCHFTHWYTGSV